MFRPDAAVALVLVWRRIGKITKNAHFRSESSNLAIPVGTGECIQMNTKVTGKHGDTSGKTPGGTCDTTSTFVHELGRPPTGLKFSSFWLVLSNYFFNM